MGGYGSDSVSLLKTELSILQGQITAAKTLVTETQTLISGFKGNIKSDLQLVLKAQQQQLLDLQLRVKDIKDEIRSLEEP